MGALSLLLLSCTAESGPVVRVATAANMKPVMDSLIGFYAKQTGRNIEVSTGSSGKLFTQIKAGAPFDIFVSADSVYPARLFREGVGKEPRVYAYGRLILLSFRPDLTLDLNRLNEPDFQPISLANPETAPYGRAAREVLVNLTYFSELENKLVKGESISQTNQFLQTGAAACGFTGQSILYAWKSAADFQYLWVPDSLYSPISQAAMLIEQPSRIAPEAQDFFDFLFSPEAAGILTYFGYRLPTSS